MSELANDVAVQRVEPDTETRSPAPSRTISPVGDLAALASSARATPGPSTAPSARVQRTASSLLVQPKLAVGASNDPFEVEADRVADQVVRSIRRSPMSEGATTSPSAQSLVTPLDRVQRSPGVLGPPTISNSEEQVQRKSVPNLASLARPTGTWTDTGNGVFGFDTPSNADDVVALLSAIRHNTRDNPMRIKVLTGIHGSEPGGGYEGGHLVGTDPVDPARFLEEDREEEGHAGVGGWTNVLNVRDKTKVTLEGWMNAPSSVVVLAWCYSANTVRIWDTISADWEDGTKGTGFQAW